jgi:hypothetical protein
MADVQVELMTQIEDAWTVWRPVVGALSVAAAVCWLIFRARPGFTLRAKAGRVTIRGRIPPGHRQHVMDFLSSAPGAVKVTGRWSGRGELRLRVSAGSAGERQRIRNYLMTTLRPG